MGLTFEEALVAATINGAWSLDRAGIVGSLEPGKLMDAVLVDGDAIDLIRVGAPVDCRGDQGRAHRVLAHHEVSPISPSSICSRLSGRRSPRRAAARRRRWPARSARRCWRWSRACRSRAPRPRRIVERLHGAGRAARRCAGSARGADRSRQRARTSGRGRVQAAEGDGRGEGARAPRQSRRRCAGRRRAARRHARLRGRHRAGRRRRRARQPVGVERRAGRLSSCSARRCAGARVNVEINLDEHQGRRLRRSGLAMRSTSWTARARHEAEAAAQVSLRGV